MTNAEMVSRVRGFARIEDDWAVRHPFDQTNNEDGPTELQDAGDGAA